MFVFSVLNIDIASLVNYTHTHTHTHTTAGVAVMAMSMMTLQQTKVHV